MLRTIRSALLAALVTGLPASPSIAQTGGANDPAALDATILVTEDSGLSRLAEPVSGGIPLPAGAVHDPADLRLLDPSGLPIACQIHPLGLSWPDGSIRWVLVQFQADLPANATLRFRLVADGRIPRPAAPEGLAVLDLGESVRVTTGPMRLEVSREDFRLPNRLWVDDRGRFGTGTLVVAEGGALDLVADREAMSVDEFVATGRPASELASFGLSDRRPPTWGRVRSGIDYRACLAGRVRIAVEEVGPFRAVLRIERDAPELEGEIGFVVRIYAYAGKKFFRAELTTRNYERLLPVAATPDWFAISNTKHVRRFVYRFRPALGVPATVEFGTDGAPVTAPATADVRMAQLSPGACSVAAGGSRIAGGERAPGWASVAFGSRRATVATKWFWEIAPKALSWDAGRGELALELRPADAPGPGYPLAPGREKTYEFLVGFDVGGPALSATARAESRATPGPAYAAATCATTPFVPLDDRRFPAYAAYVANTVYRDNVPAARLLGDVDFGDRAGWTATQRWNGYHGVSHESFVFALASGGPFHFRLAEAAVWHTMDVDTFHWGDQAGAREAEYARAEDHVCTSPIQGGIKVWNLGEIAYYLLTGRRRVLEVLARTADFLMRTGGGNLDSLVPDRATSLPLLHLAAMYEVLGSEAAIAAYYPAAYVPRTGEFRPRGDSVGLERSMAWLKHMRVMVDFLSWAYERGEMRRTSFIAAYPAEGFYRYWALTGDGVAAAGVERAAGFLYFELVLPTGMPRYADEPGTPESVRWMPGVDEVELPAVRAWQVTGSPKWLEYGKAPVDWIVHYRCVATSSTGPGAGTAAFLWALGAAGLTEADLARMRPDLDYSAALAIAGPVALRGLSLPPGSESRRYVLLAEELGRVLLDLDRARDAVDWLSPWETTFGTGPASPASDLPQFLGPARARVAAGGR